MAKNQWLIAHLSRPLEADYGKDKVYMHDVIDKYPELVEFVREHIVHPEDMTENLILDAHMLDYAKIAGALLVDMHFKIVSIVDSSNKHLQDEEKNKRIEAIMASVREVAES